MTRVRFVVAAAILAGCARHHDAARASATDARRIVSVSPSTTEALFAIGDADRVVGRSRYCDWPPETAKIPVVGGFFDVDLEAVLELGPDLVVGASGPSSARLEEKLGARGIATFFPPSDSLAAIDAMILGLGQRTNRLADATQVVRDVDARVHAVERAVAGEPTPRVLLVLDVSPVVAAGPKSFVDELIARAGATNVLSAGGPWQAVDLEQIAELGPDVVVDASGGHDAGASRITPRAPGWEGVKAVREGHVVALNDERALRPGPRVAEGLATLAREIHPDAAVPSW
jgi:iron complex transport system substrate-binding protein